MFHALRYCWNLTFTVKALSDENSYLCVLNCRIMHLLKSIIIPFALAIMPVYTYGSDGGNIPAMTHPTHTVVKGETLYGIGKLYGVSPELLVEYNPWAKDGVKAGQELILIPSVPTDPPAREQSADDIVAGAFSASNTDTTDTGVIEIDSVSHREYNITVMLPFMLDEGDNPSKNASAYTNFYKGFIMAANEMSDECPEGSTVKIVAIDTEGRIAKVDSLIHAGILGEADVVVAPDDSRQLALLAEASSKDGFYIFNIFNVQDGSHNTCPQMMQANIDHSRMYEKAMDAIETLYPGYELVILHNEAGKAEKKEFADGVRQMYINTGLPVSEISFKGILRPSDLESRLKPGHKYLFLPTSGTLQEFNKINRAISAMKEKAGNPDDIRLFGYPEWMTFRIDRLEKLHQLDTSIYSRYFVPAEDATISSVSDRYAHWYGEEIRDMVPRQELLGYDAGRFIIGALYETDGDFRSVPFRHEGVQSSFMFTPASGSDKNCGLVNNALYIVNFHPDGSTSKNIR